MSKKTNHIDFDVEYNNKFILNTPLFYDELTFEEEKLLIEGIGHG